MVMDITIIMIMEIMETMEVTVLVEDQIIMGLTQMTMEVQIIIQLLTIVIMEIMVIMDGDDLFFHFRVM